MRGVYGQALRDFAMTGKTDCMEQAEAQHVLSSVMLTTDRRTLSEIIDVALKRHAFCEPERGIIVQVVCDSLITRAASES